MDTLPIFVCFGVIIIVIVIVLLWIQRFICPSLFSTQTVLPDQTTPPPQTVPTICAVMTGNDGFSPDGEPYEQKLIREVTTRGVVPLKEGVDFSYLTTTENNLAKDVEDKYNRGARIFFGTTSSKELLTVKSFLDTHKDIMWLSTASVTPIDFVNRNVFRLSGNNVESIGNFDSLLKISFPNTPIIVVVDTTDIYSTTLGGLFKNIGYRMITFEEYFVLQKNTESRDLLPISGILFLSTNTPLVNEAIIKTGSDYYPIMVGNPQSNRNYQPPKDIYGLEQEVHPECQFMGYSVYGTNISPVIYTLTACMWYISDIYLSSKGLPNINYAERFQSLYGPNLIHYFTDDQFGFFNPALLTGWNIRTKTWSSLRNYLKSVSPFQGSTGEYFPS